MSARLFMVIWFGMGAVCTPLITIAVPLVIDR